MGLKFDSTKSCSCSLRSEARCAVARATSAVPRHATERVCDKEDSGTAQGDEEDQEERDLEEEAARAHGPAQIRMSSNARFAARVPPRLHVARARTRRKLYGHIHVTYKII